jgi:Protein of unknown function (DUF3017)
MTTEREPVAAKPPRRGALGVVLRQWPLLIVLGGGLTALLVVASDGFRLGCTLLGASVGFAAVARAVLPARRVGLLVVRSRLFDVVVLAVMGAALVVLAVVVPGPPD